MVALTRTRKPYKHLPPFSGTGNPSAGTSVLILDDADHNGFPGACRLNNGDLIVVYRTGTSHTTTDGNQEIVRSTNSGATWSAPSSLINNANDVRDVGLTRLANGKVIRTWFENNAGAYTSYSSLSTDATATAWAAAVTIGTSFTGYSIVSAPVVELGNGDLIVAVYGMNTGGTWEGIRLARSTNGGTSWADSGQIAPTPSSYSLQEPNIALLDNGTLLCMVRMAVGTGQIGRTYSTDGGSTWDRLVEMWPGTGRPSVAQRGSDGAVVVMYRRADNDDCRFRTSWDRGGTFNSTDGDFTGGSTNRMEYGQWVDLSGGGLGVGYSIGATLSNSDLYWNTLV